MSKTKTLATTVRRLRRFRSFIKRDTMNRQRLLIIALSVSLAAGGLSASGVAAQEMSFAFKGYQRTDYIDPDSVSAAEALALVQNGEVRAYNAWDLLHRVGLSGDTTFVEPLKQLAEAFTLSDTASTSGFNALYALRLLGVPKAYFLENAFVHQQNLWLAKYSIDMLAQSPDSTTLDILETIRQETPNGYIHGALNGYRGALFGEKFYQELASPTEQAQFLIHNSSIGSGLTPWGFEAGNPDSGLDPIAVWARLRLRALYQEHPTVVEQEIAAIEPVPDAPFPHLADKLRTLLTHVITADASEFPDPFDNPPSIPDMPGALTIASDAASASFSGGSFTLSGFDHTLDGTPAASGNDAHGIIATAAAAQQSLLDALANNQQNSVVGLDTPPDIAQGALDFDPATLIEALLALVTDTLTVEHTGTLGSVESPVVAYAPEGLVLSGNLTGIGALIVDGPLV